MKEAIDLRVHVRRVVGADRGVTSRGLGTDGARLDVTRAVAREAGYDV